METNNKYGIDWTIIASYLSGNATEVEKSEVQAWLEKSDENKGILRGAEKLWKMTESAAFTNINVDTAWENVNSKSHIISESRTRYLFSKTYKYALRVAAVLIIGILTWYMISNVNYDKTAKSGSAITELALNDGSQVTMNKDSKLKFPKVFKGETREVYLEGEAFFSIVKNLHKPFIIKTAYTQIEVLGTSFNVSTNQNGDVEVTVNSGIVSFESKKNNQHVILKKDDKGTFLKSSGVIEKNINNNPNYISWKTRKFIFHETRLKDIFSEVERVYSVNIVVKDSAIYNCRMTATFDKLPIDEIINSIDLAFKYKSSKIDNIYTIEGNDCTKQQ
jgi:transmembrane sensor